LQDAWLTVEQLHCERDDRLLFDGLSFSAASGQLWQVVGPNGAGKTTLLRILVGLHGHFEGKVDWQVAGDLREQLLYIGHQPGLRDELTPLENLRWLDALHGERDVDLWAALAQVGLTGFEDVPVAHLSAGQKRRVALARLWPGRKPVWVLDEPFTAIDASGVAQVEARLAEHAEQGGLVIYTSHHRLNDRVRQLHLGEAQA
jgi:heme exporter protein A